MILRQTVVPSALDALGDDDTAYDRHLGGWNKSPLKWRLSMVAAVMVAVAVGIMTVAAYWAVSTSMAREVDKQLQNKAESLLAQSLDPGFLSNAQAEIQEFKSYNPLTRVLFFPPGAHTGVGDAIQLVDEVRVVAGAQQHSSRESGDERIVAVRNDAGAAIVLAQNLQQTHRMISGLGLLLLTIGGVGVLVAIATGIVVARTGLRPVTRLQQAAEHVTRTGDLNPIPVVGDDELAQLTTSFNSMLSALQASRVRQAELVADAGHELKTPLTSLRTNVELLMMVSKSGGATISEADRQDLECDVIAQIEEMSSLIGDLVDLAREDGPQQVVELVDFREIVDEALTRVERRRVDVQFHYEPTTEWFLYGDPFALGRAVLNILDNAGKWSPTGGVVRVCLRRGDDGSVAALTVSDSGPGIPEADRERVFQRFYRAVQARSTPGSGLGLAIVKQVVERHGGTITASESDDHGTCMTMVLPGSATNVAVEGNDAFASPRMHSTHNDGRNDAQEGAEKDTRIDTRSDTGERGSTRQEIFGTLWERNTRG